MANRCFTCDSELCSEYTTMCSSFTLYSRSTYPEKLVEILGDAFLVIVTADGQMCTKCSSLLNYFDKCQKDLLLVRNTMLSNIQSKYGILRPNEIIKSVDVIDGHLIIKEHPVKRKRRRKRKVPDTVPKVIPTATTAAVDTPIQTPIKLLNTQKQYPPQQPELQQQSPHHQQQQQESAKKIKTYKCRFCGFHSKWIGKVRFHMGTHANQNDAQNPILNQAAAETLTTVPQQEKILFTYSKNFDSQFKCADHMLKDHNRPTPSTSNIKKEKDNEDTELPEQEEADQKTLVSVKKKADQKTPVSVKKEADEDY